MTKNKQATTEVSEYDEMTYEQIVELLEDTVASMDDPKVGIEKVTEYYERAKILEGIARQRLEAVRTRLEAIESAK